MTRELIMVTRNSRVAGWLVVACLAPLGGVATDAAVQAADKFPTKAVFAPLDINPQIVMWDPATYPTLKAWPDVAHTKAKVLYLEGLPFMDFLVEKGFVTKDQKDASFD